MHLHIEYSQECVLYQAPFSMVLNILFYHIFVILTELSFLIVLEPEKKS